MQSTRLATTPNQLIHYLCPFNFGWKRIFSKIMKHLFFGAEYRILKINTDQQGQDHVSFPCSTLTQKEEKN